MKPLLRWTIGPVRTIGFDILKESVRRMKYLYGSTFDFVICHNQINSEQKDYISKLGADIYEQKHEVLEYKPAVENWKLYPPRLRQDAHEIVVDNDLVLFKKLDKIDSFLASNTFLICQGIYRLFGKYADKGPAFGVNSGLYGMPPGFDFADAIRDLQKDDLERSWSARFDDQGVIATIFTKHDYVMIPRSEIQHIGEQESVLPSNVSGYHFIGANSRGSHKAWESYRRKAISHLL